MTTYKDIRGTHITTVTTDLNDSRYGLIGAGTYTATIVAGEIVHQQQEQQNDGMVPLGLKLQI